MAKDAVRKAATRKPQSETTDLPAENTVEEKSTATKAKSGKKKTVGTGAGKSTAKRVDKKVVLSESALKRIENIKGKANGLILCIKQDTQAAAKGEVNPMQVQRMFKAMMELIVEARGNMYRDSK